MTDEDEEQRMHLLRLFMDRLDDLAPMDMRFLVTALNPKSQVYEIKTSEDLWKNAREVTVTIWEPLKSSRNRPIPLPVPVHPNCGSVTIPEEVGQYGVTALDASEAIRTVGEILNEANKKEGDD